MCENCRILIQSARKIVPTGPINNTSALVQIMAWRRTGEKPLFEPIMTYFSDVYASLGLNELIYC